MGNGAGPAAASFGVYCAQLSGIPRHVLSRASQIQALQQKGQHISCIDSALLKARDAESIHIVKGIADLDTDNLTSVKTFLAEVLKSCG